MYSNWCNKKENWHLGEIFDFINEAKKKFSDEQYFKDFTIVITGKGGRTGKTCLCNQLKKAGFKCIELSEIMDMLSLADFKDDKRHVKVDEIQKSILVVLNKRIELKKGDI